MNLKATRSAIGLVLSILLVSVASLLYYRNSNLKDVAHSQLKFDLKRQNELQQYVRQLQKDFPVPGLAVAVVKGDSIFFTAAGFKNSRRDSMQTNTLVFAGSISEPLLATAILKLSKEGKIDLDDAVIDHLPYFQMGGPNYKKVTIRHLLTHTSGIDKYDIIWEDLNGKKPNAVEVTTRSIASQLPKFSVPGTRVFRSPYNYDILADVISKVTKMPFEEYLKKEVMVRAGMNTSTFSKPTGNQAMPFKIADWLSHTLKQDSIYPYNRENAGSNGLHTTAADIAVWMKSILVTKGTSLLGGKELKELKSIQFSTGNTSAIGLGFEVLKTPEQNILLKGSHYMGFNSQLMLLPEKRIGVAVLGNISGYTNIASASKHISDWLQGKPLIMPKIPVGMVLSREFQRTKKLDFVFALYKKIKRDSQTRYDCSVEALSELGLNFLYKFRDSKRAIEVFEFCTQQFPESAYAHMYLAEAHIANKDVSKCKLALAKAKSFASKGSFNYRQAAHIQESIDVLEEKKNG